MLRLRHGLAAVLIALCTACVSVKRAPPPQRADLVGDWIGNGGAETYLVRLQTNGLGDCVSMFWRGIDSSRASVVRWELKGFDIEIACKGIRFPEETFVMKGKTSGGSMNLHLRGKSPSCSWERDVTLRPVNDLLAEIAVGRAALK